MRWMGWLFVAQLACSGGSDDAEEKARVAMTEGQYGVAMDKAAQGLKSARTAGDRAAIWRLELIVLESMARSGQGLGLVEELDRLSKDYASQVNAKLYLSLGSYAKDAGDTNGAIELWATGDKRFPSDTESFKTAIESLQNAGDLAPAELEKLKSLGYIQ